MMTDDLHGKVKKPENEKVRKKRMNALNEKIDTLREQYLTLRNHIDDVEAKNKQSEEDIKGYKVTIAKLRKQKEEFVKYRDEIAEMDLEKEDIESIKKEKHKLATEVQRLRKDLNDAQKDALAAEEEITKLLDEEL